MALIKCTECGGKVSSKAAACPHCGCPVSEMDFPDEILLSMFGAGREQLRYDETENRVYVGDAPLEDGVIIEVLVLNRYWLHAVAFKIKHGWLIVLVEEPGGSPDYRASSPRWLTTKEDGRYVWGWVGFPETEVYARMPDGKSPALGEMQRRKSQSSKFVQEMNKRGIWDLLRP